MSAEFPSHLEVSEARRARRGILRFAVSISHSFVRSSHRATGPDCHEAWDESDAATFNGSGDKRWDWPRAAEAATGGRPMCRFPRAC